ncbi:hypothetical protein SE924_10090 [Legionella pneumophila]|nr:hypothetical protein [Legionella pneumophila]
MEEKIREFVAQSNEGNSIGLVEYRKLIDITTAADKTKQYRHGLPRFTTKDGKTINCIDGGYQILGDDELFYEVT